MTDPNPSRRDPLLEDILRTAPRLPQVAPGAQIVPGARVAPGAQVVPGAQIVPGAQVVPRWQPFQLTRN